MIIQFVGLSILSAAFASDFLCDENFPIVTDFGIDDCDATENLYYSPTAHHGCMPGCQEIKFSSGYLCSAQNPCPPGYYCPDQPGQVKCQIDEDSCLKYYFVYTNSRWRPNCRSDGSWEAKQCKGDRCFCYDPKGARIYGTAFATQAANMTCACSRKRAELEADQDLNYYFVSLHCDDMGNYEPLQCSNGQCWCADPKTGDLLTPTVPEKMMTRLPCYKKDEIGSQYLRVCESEVYAQARIRDEFIAHGTTRVNFPHLRCLYDGSFGPTKIQNGIVYCVWRDNIATGYAADLNGIDIADIDCHCARDSKIYEAVGMPLLRSCLANGNYNPVQRDGDEYYCVDRDGFRISDILTTEPTAEKCKEMK